jgi:hypothetical protein
VLKGNRAEVSTNVDVDVIRARCRSRHPGERGRSGRDQHLAGHGDPVRTRCGMGGHRAGALAGPASLT